MKEANGEILWVDDECVGYKCECGNDDLIISIYLSESNQCPKCGRLYQLVQHNTIFELGEKEK